jgi:hypothetical protein
MRIAKLICVFLICAPCFAKSKPIKPLKCPVGKAAWGGMGSSGAEVPYACYTPKDKAKAKVWFAEQLCGEGGIVEFGEGYLYAHHSDWVNRSCHERDEWSKRLPNGNWVPITEEGYYRGRCAEATWYSNGQVTKHYPKPEWTECSKPPQQVR